MKKDSTKTPNLFARYVLLLGLVCLPSLGLAQGDSWVKKANMPTARRHLATCVLDGKIYAVGGSAVAGGPGLHAVEAYDPAANSWTVKASMPTARGWFATESVNGRIYAIGGDSVGFLPSPLKTVEEYDPSTDQWARKANMPTAREGFATAVVAGNIYVIGGLTGRTTPALATVEVYDPVTDTWSSKAALPTPRGMLCASVVEGRIFTMGASQPGGSPLSTLEVYDAQIDRWTSKANMPTPRGASGASSVHGRIYVMGGRTPDSPLANVEEFSLITDTWTKRTNIWSTTPGISTPLFGFGANEVNGRIYAIGGASEISVEQGLSQVLEYTPPADSGEPVIYSQPQSQSVLGGTVRFAVGAAGQEPLFYQWQFNGLTLTNSTNATLTLSNLAFHNSGDLQVVVSNLLGTVTSQTAKLIVAPLLITAQTGNTNVWPGSNVFFQLAITSNVPATCQWRFNGTNIPGATNLVFSITNVQLVHEGDYSAECINRFGSVTSTPARLLVLIVPSILQPPLSQSVVAGGNITWSALIGGNPPPFGYQWRRGSTVLTNIVQSERTCFFTVTNVQPNQAATYRLVVTNAAAPGLTVNTTFNLTVLSDTDGDGMPDAWESAHGFNPNLAADAGFDPDHDGSSNLQEYLAGTNPIDVLSVLQIDSVGLTNLDVDFILRFHALSNKTYTVQAWENWETGSWRRVLDIAAASTNRVLSVVESMLSSTNQADFYRVVTPRAP